MMKSEFIERTGFEPTEAEYREIEAEYMGCDIDKDEFCKTWKKQGGWTIVNKKDTIFKYIFWERLDSLPIPECCFHFVWCQIA